MPSKIWLTLRVLTLQEISWGIENNIFSNTISNSTNCEQYSLKDCGFQFERSEKELEKYNLNINIMPFPGPSENNYKFLS